MFTNQSENFFLEYGIKTCRKAERRKCAGFDTKIQGGIILINADIFKDGRVAVYQQTVSDSVLFERIKFKFPDSWSGYAKTAVFRHKDTVINVILDSENELCTGENECYIPHEVIKYPFFTVSAFGVKDTSVATTERAAINVIQSGYEEGDVPSEPTPTEYQQLINLVGDAKSTAQSVRDDADSGLFKGEKGDTGAQGEKGEQGETGAQGPVGPVGPQGEKGDPFTYDDFTTEQLAALKGEKGDKGDPGEVENIDNTYNPESANAQSGTAVAEGITGAENRARDSFANAIKGSASGYALSITDVSPVAHNISVKVSGAAGEDLTAVKVTRIGKNLLDLQDRTDAKPTGNWPISKYDTGNVIYRGFAYSGYYQLSEASKSDVTVDGNTVTFTQKANGYGIGYVVKCCPNTNYYFSGTISCDVFCAIFIDTDGNKISDTFFRKFTTPQNARYILLSFSNNNTTGSYAVSNPQLEIGEKATDFEVYKEAKEFIPDADGTVAGITSLYPSTSLFTDTENIEIECEYNIDIKKYIDSKITAVMSLTPEE